MPPFVHILHKTNNNNNISNGRGATTANARGAQLNRQHNIYEPPYVTTIMRVALSFFPYTMG